MNQPPEILVINGRRYVLDDMEVIFINGPLRGKTSIESKLKVGQILLTRTFVGSVDGFQQKDVAYLVTNKKDESGRTILKHTKLP